jgi:non-specific serine/threonine protein kinase
MLRECSLLVAQEEEPESDALRFRLLETLREYAAEKLTPEERARLRQRHAGYFLAWAEMAARGLEGPEQSAWLARLEMEHDNLRAALDACEESGQAEIGLRLCVALTPFWSVRGHLREGRERLTRLMALSEAYPVPEAVRIGALTGLGRLAYTLGDYAAAHALHAECLSLCRKSGDKAGMARALHYLGSVAFERGDYPLAHALHEESLALRRELGDKPGIASSLHWLGIVATNRGEFEQAKTLLQESLALRQEGGDKGGIAGCYNSLGIVARRQGDYAAARDCYTQSLVLKREIGDNPGIADSLEGFAGLAIAQGRAERAATLFAAAEALRAAIGSPLSPVERAESERLLAAARKALSPDIFAHAWSQGRKMPVEQAIAFALE